MNCPKCGTQMKSVEDEHGRLLWHCIKCEQGYEVSYGEFVATATTSDF